jgi:GntR family transcriptional regulator
MRGYRDLAADLRRRIADGEFPAGSTLPRIEDLEAEFGLSRQTVRAAIAELANEGLVTPIRKRGTVVRDRSTIRIPLSRYGNVLEPGGTKGPWESACAAQGLDGRMKVIGVEREPATDELAALLEVSPGTELVHRRRHALIGEDIAQIQNVWYVAELAERAGIAGTGKVVGGVFGALTAAGTPPFTADERVNGRMPTLDEANELKIGAGVPLLAVERITRSADRQVLEVLRVVAPADRTELLYDNLPLGRQGSS